MAKEGIIDIANKALIQTQEALFEIKKCNNKLFIGIPKEVTFQENRVPLTPLSVALLINNGHRVLLESGAGLGASFTDNNYSEQGAEIVYSNHEIYKADVILKIAPPTLAEATLMKYGQCLLSGLQTSAADLSVLKILIEKKVTALSFEYLRDEAGVLSVVQAMSEIVGTTSVFIASEYLSNVVNGKGLMLGGITGVPPTEIVIIGAGTVGEYAARTALALGAQVKIFDSSLSRLRRIQNNLGERIFTSILQPIILHKAITSCDVAIGAIRSSSSTHGRSPCIVSEETVSKMKPNSVIVDVSIDQGGCFETSKITNHTNPVFKLHDVIHYCVPNIASRVSRTASYALTNILAPLMIDMGEKGGLNNLIWNHSGVRNAAYLYQGQVTNRNFADKFNLQYKDLNLLAFPLH